MRSNIFYIRAQRSLRTHAIRQYKYICDYLRPPIPLPAACALATHSSSLTDKYGETAAHAAARAHCLDTLAALIGEGSGEFRIGTSGSDAGRKDST